jgi:hypothetical protein
LLQEIGLDEVLQEFTEDGIGIWRMGLQGLKTWAVMVISKHLFIIVIGQI